MAIKLQTPQGAAVLWRGSWSCPENHDLQGLLNAHFAGMTTLEEAEQVAGALGGVVSVMGRSADESPQPEPGGVVHHEVPPEIADLDRALADTYFGNFSVFQSAPDAWAVKQLFPLIPIQRLGEKPTAVGCTSTGYGPGISMCIPPLSRNSVAEMLPRCGGKPANRTSSMTPSRLT